MIILLLSLLLPLPLAQVQVESFTVGSTTKVSSPPLTINPLVPVGTTAQYNLYAWSTTTFRCGIPLGIGSQFACPPDPSAFAVQPVFSPLGSFFDGICPPGPGNTFLVCVYACQQFEAVLCNTNSMGVPSIVSFNEVDPLITFDLFEFGVPDLVLSYGMPMAAAGGAIAVPLLYQVIAPIFGYQITFTGPTPTGLDGGANDDADFDVQFSPVFDLFLGISFQGRTRDDHDHDYDYDYHRDNVAITPITLTTLSFLLPFPFPFFAGNSIVEIDGAPALLFNILFDPADAGLEFCILTSDLNIQTVFSGASGVQLGDIFDGNNCIILETPPCPTAGNGDVTLDGQINVQVRGEDDVWVAQFGDQCHWHSIIVSETVIISPMAALFLNIMMMMMMMMIDVVIDDETLVIRAENFVIMTIVIFIPKIVIMTPIIVINTSIDPRVFFQVFLCLFSTFDFRRTWCCC